VLFAPEALDTTRQIYELDARDQARRYFGDSVTVEGTLQGNSIQVAAIKKLTSIGLEVGQRAPEFLGARSVWP